MTLPSPNVIDPQSTVPVRDFRQINFASKTIPNTDAEHTRPHWSTHSSTNDGLHIQHVNAVAGLVNSVIQDISRRQLQICENERRLGDAKLKLQKIEELTDSLGATSPATLPIIVPLQNKMRAECRSLEMKVEQDIKKLSDAWEKALNIFLRAICEQFDKELEAGTEFLYQETRVFFNSLSKKCMIPDQKSANSHSKPTNSLTQCPDSDETPGQSLPRNACLQNNSNTHCQSADFMETISGMQEQLERQSEKIEYLLQQDELVSRQ